MASREDEDRFNERVRSNLRRWAVAGTEFPVGRIANVSIVDVGQTTASVELVPGVCATLRVKQMREAGFGPEHSFALEDHLTLGQQVTIRVTKIDPDALTAEADFLSLAPSPRGGTSPR